MKVFDFVTAIIQLMKGQSNQQTKFWLLGFPQFIFDCLVFSLVTLLEEVLLCKLPPFVSNGRF